MAHTYRMATEEKAAEYRDTFREEHYWHIHDISTGPYSYVMECECGVSETVTRLNQAYDDARNVLYSDRAVIFR